MICTRDVNSKPRYRRPSCLEAAKRATGPGSRLLDEWYCFHARYDHGHALSFWEKYPVDGGEANIIPILEKVCLDCFDAAWRAASRVRPFTFDVINNEVSRLCARALKGGKTAPKYVWAPNSLERASVLANWAQGAQARKLIEIATSVYAVNREWVYSYHLDDHANRHLSMSNETPAFMHKYRAAYRHARRAAGIKGKVCREFVPSHWHHCGYHRFDRTDRHSEAGVVFVHEAFIAERVNAEVATQIKSLESGEFGEQKVVWGSSWKWEGNLAAQILFEYAYPKWLDKDIPNYIDRSYNYEGQMVLTTADKVDIAMLNPTIVPLASRLAYFKRCKREALEFRAQAEGRRRNRAVA